MHNTQVAVLGTGCPSCKKLFELTTQAAQELGLEATVEYITDIQKIVAMGIIQTPALAINGVPVLTGATNDIDTIKTLLAKGTASGNPAKGSTSGCGCNCKGGC